MRQADDPLSPLAACPIGFFRLWFRYENQSIHAQIPRAAPRSRSVGSQRGGGGSLPPIAREPPPADDSVPPCRWGGLRPGNAPDIRLEPVQPVPSSGAAAGRRAGGDAAR